MGARIGTRMGGGSCAALAMATAMALVADSGCAGPRGTAESPSPAGPPQATTLPATLTFQADVAPVRALAATPGFLWIGSDRGLRRVRLPAGSAEWVGADVGMAGRRVSALASDGGSGVWIAADGEVGRLSEVGGRLRYRMLAKLAGVTHIGPVATPAARAARPPAENSADVAWVGAPTGLFLLQGAQSTPLSGAPAGAITSLDVEEDGKSAWVGVAGRGLIQVDTRKVLAVFGPDGPERLDFVASTGTALLPNGTRLALGRDGQGRSRILLLRRTGGELLSPEPDLTALALVPAATNSTSPPGHPLLLAGPPSAPRLYNLQASDRGEVLGGGLVRFSPARKNLGSLRLAARPEPRRLPPEVTVAIMVASAASGAEAGAGEIFVGTRSLGAARLTEGGPAYLPAGELALEARALSVTCLEQERCFFATGRGPAWVWEGGDRPIKPLPLVAGHKADSAPVAPAAGATGTTAAASVSGAGGARGGAGGRGGRGATSTATAAAGPAVPASGTTGPAATATTARIPEAVMAFAGDGRDVVYAITRGDGKDAKEGKDAKDAKDGKDGKDGKTVRISRLSKERGQWDEVLSFSVQVEGTPIVTFATLSPRGQLWMSLRDQTPSAQEFGRGVLEVQLAQTASPRAIHHRPYRQGEARPPESIPVAGDVTAIRFQKGAGAGDMESIWFCTSLGVVRFVGGQLSQWGENEGLDSETCRDLEVARDGTVWAATEAGVAHFDGTGWRRLGSGPASGLTPASAGSSGPTSVAASGLAPQWPADRDGDSLPARALATSGQTVWAATSRGLWPVSATDLGRGASADRRGGGAIDRASGLADDDVVDLVTDRFGRLWVLGRVGITIRRPLNL